MAAFACSKKLKKFEKKLATVLALHLDGMLAGQTGLSKRSKNLKKSLSGLKKFYKAT